jgi:hypothetical protein
VQEDLPNQWPLIVGGVLLLVILFLPGGLMDLRSRFRRERLRAERATAATYLGAAGADPQGS